MLSLIYWVCTSRCLETVSNPGQVSRSKKTCWSSYWRLDFELRLVKNMMRALPKPVWPEWLAQKLGLRWLKRLEKFSAVFLFRPLVSFREALLAGCLIGNEKKNTYSKRRTQNKTVKERPQETTNKAGLEKRCYPSYPSLLLLDVRPSPPPTLPLSILFNPCFVTRITKRNLRT